jgi:hypothetical protein
MGEPAPTNWSENPKLSVIRPYILDGLLRGWGRI